MDALIDDVAELDGPLLAAMWTRAVLAGDADLIAVWEAECAARGVRAQSLVAAARRPLVAAKAKKDDDEPTHIDPGKRSGGPRSYAEITAQSQKNIREGKSYDTGQATYKNSKGYNPYRKKKGEKGGGQFTTKEGAQTTDPNVARTPLEEDDPSIPDKSPKGAEIEDFRDGMMIYKDGTRYDGEGWRDSKGRALDSKGNVIKKTAGKGGGSGTSAVEREKEKAKKAAEKAKKDQERQESRDWDTAESRRKADAAAKEGNYASLLSIVERNETAARKARDFAKSPEAREKAELEVARAQKELADVKAAATKAKADKEITDKAEREKKAEAAKKEREAEREKENAAEYAAIAANYPAWEKELREKYAEVGLSEAEMADLIIRDRARRVRLLPRKKRSYKGNPTSNLETMPTITPGPSTGGQIVTSAGYDPALHPKGKDGKWIEKLGLVDVFGLSGFQHGQRGHKQVQGQVVEIVPNPSSPGDPVIRVKMTDPRWDPAKFGETVDVKRSQVAQRVKPKGKLEPKAPAVDIAKPSFIQLDETGGIPPARTATPNLTPHPDGPNLAPAVLPGDWSTMDNPARLAWVKDRLDTDLTAWRGEPTTSDFTGMDAGIAFNLANTYRDLVNWDPDTARRIDHPILPSSGGSNGLGHNAIAVAHPGTAHPGGIGEKIKPSSDRVRRQVHVVDGVLAEAAGCEQRLEDAVLDVQHDRRPDRHPDPRVRAPPPVPLPRRGHARRRQGVVRRRARRRVRAHPRLVELGGDAGPALPDPEAVPDQVRPLQVVGGVRRGDRRTRARHLVTRVGRHVRRVGPVHGADDEVPAGSALGLAQLRRVDRRREGPVLAGQRPVPRTARDA